MTNTDAIFIENEKRLSRSFSYDLISCQLHLLARRKTDFSVPPSEKVSGLASILLNHLLNYSGREESLKSTLLYVQTRELISDYLLFRENHQPNH